MLFAGSIAIGVVSAILAKPDLTDWQGAIETLRAALSEPPSSIALWPFVTASGPMYAQSVAEWRAAFPAALLLMLLHAWWVLRTDSAFEEAALAATAERARRIEAIRTRRWSGLRDQPKRPRTLTAPPLRAEGHPVMAIVWKNWLCLRRKAGLRTPVAPRPDQKQYGGEDKYFVTGFEAGGHTVWGILFNYPEVVRGAALVCPNYLGRWVDEGHISSAAERTVLPIRNLIGTKDDLCAVGNPIYTQMQRAMSLADAHGYKNVSLVRVEGKGHERLANEVLAYFSSLLQH